jgi:hypothetical protein
MQVKEVSNKERSNIKSSLTFNITKYQFAILDLLMSGENLNSKKQ